jgi:DNA-binding transcriptional ArsR family regulator
LTREFFDREYLQAGKTPRDLEAETGFPRKFPAATAREHGITPASASAPTRLAILLTLQDGERRITDLAADLGGSQAGISSVLACTSTILSC